MVSASEKIGMYSAINTNATNNPMKIAPAGSILPPLCLIAYAVTGESAIDVAEHQRGGGVILPVEPDDLDRRLAGRDACCTLRRHLLGVLDRVGLYRDPLAAGVVRIDRAAGLLRPLHAGAEVGGEVDGLSRAPWCR